MSEKSYHHGNLKHALIEAGIELMNEVGEEQMSLRKIAARCNVSSAAPYAHFKDMDELLHAMQEHVTDEFMVYLLNAIEKSENKDGKEAIFNVGKAYVLFFANHPQYYKFLYYHEFIKIDLSMDSHDNFKPFELFRDLVLRVNRAEGKKINKEEQELEILKLWADVQGFASIASMKNVIWSKSWEETIEML